MDQNEIRELLKAGIEAARDGNKIIARDYFRRVLEQDPSNETALLWMANASDSRSEQIRLLQRVLQLNPNNENARNILQRLQASGSAIDVPSSPTTSEQNSLEGLRRSTVSGEARSAQRQTTAQGYQRDWSQPIERGQTPAAEVWRRSNQASNENLLPLLLVGAIAVVLIGLSIFLLLGDDDGDDEEPTVNANANATQIQLTAARQTIIALTPTNTPQQIWPEGTVVQLPPTLAPTVTNTPLPTPTRTPEPHDPVLYDLLVQVNEASGDPYYLLTMVGDGTNRSRVAITLPELQLNPDALATEEPSDATEPTPEDDTEVAQEPTQVPPETPAPPPAREELIDPAYSPDGQFIVFTGQIGEIQELFVVPASGGIATQLTVFSTGRTGDAVWSFDGQKIYFASDADGDFELYEILPDGTGLRQITENEFQDRQPALSPNGDYLAFASDRAGIGELEIFVFPVAGGPDICQMTDAKSSSFSPHWSPDGRQIIFISNRSGDNDLYIMRSDGSAETLITIDDSDAEDYDAAWSPDGEWIVVSSTRSSDGQALNATTQLWLVTPNGQLWSQVSNMEGEHRNPVWLPSVSRPEVTDFQFICASS